MKILLTGATGLVGSSLGTKLSEQGDELFVVSRNKKIQLPFPFTLVSGDLSVGPLPSLQQYSFDAVFHLMGETVAQSWTETAKKSMTSSRIQATQNLLNSLSSIKHFIQASAIGYYGDQKEKILSEDSPNGEDFLADLCRQWEHEGSQIKSRYPEARWAALRIGLVLSNKGGALQKMLPPFRLGLGATLGSGSQYMSWIHIEDLVQAFIYVLNNQALSGPINAVAPQPVTNKEFSQAVARTLHRPLLLSAPPFVLKIALGEMATLLLSSQKVEPKKLLAYGFKFNFNQLEIALNNLLLE